MAAERSSHALFRGFALVTGIVILVAIGLYVLTDGKINEDPSLPTPETYAAVDRLMENDPVRGARATAGLELYRHRCRLCHHRSGRGGDKFTPSLQKHDAQSAVAMLDIYRSGQKVGPMTVLMTPWAEELSEEEMHNLGEYIEILATVADANPRGEQSEGG
ncbi:MAG: cytochrome c [Candidatus Polarisedimenticolaceae bacterium]|nr:cytochrome c [Candidatus Polarisedimenticolaceae bacterium]